MNKENYGSTVSHSRQQHVAPAESAYTTGVVMKSSKTSKTQSINPYDWTNHRNSASIEQAGFKWESSRKFIRSQVSTRSNPLTGARASVYSTKARSPVANQEYLKTANDSNAAQEVTSGPILNEATIEPRPKPRTAAQQTRPPRPMHIKQSQSIAIEPEKQVIPGNASPTTLTCRQSSNMDYNYLPPTVYNVQQGQNQPGNESSLRAGSRFGPAHSSLNGYGVGSSRLQFRDFESFKRYLGPTRKFKFKDSGGPTQTTRTAKMNHPQSKRSSRISAGSASGYAAPPNQGQM